MVSSALKLQEIPSRRRAALRDRSNSGQQVAMARAPRPPLHDQVTAEAILARMDGFEGYLDAIAKDAREGRDAALGLRERISAENTQEGMAKLWAELKAVENASRSDLVNAVSRIGDAHGKLASRVESLEAWRNELKGANGLMSWLSKHAPWIFAAMAAAVAVFRVKAA